MFDGDPLFVINHVARFVANMPKVEVVHYDVLIMLFMRSLHAQDSWICNCIARIISSIGAFFDGFLKHFQACQLLDIQEEAFIEHEEDIGKDDVITPLEVDVSDYLHIEEGKWKMGNETLFYLVFYSHMSEALL